MSQSREEALAAARTERAEITKRINAMLGRMKVDAPPSLTPYTSSNADPTPLVEAAAAVSTASYAGADDLGELCEQLGVSLSEFQARQDAAGDFDEHSTPVVVISLAGLRRIEALLSELEQRKGDETP